jgi:hypothetical protein
MLPVGSGLQVSLLRQFQQLVYVVLWHATILQNVSRWQKVNMFGKNGLGFTSVERGLKKRRNCVLRLGR